MPRNFANGQRSERSYIIILFACDNSLTEAQRTRIRLHRAGLSVDELKAKIKQDQVEEARRKREEIAARPAAPVPNTPTAGSTQTYKPHVAANVRKDSSPVKVRCPICLIFASVPDAPYRSPCRRSSISQK